MTLDELPTFTVRHVEGDRAIGVVDRALWIGERLPGDVLLPGGRFVAGRFVNVDLGSLTASFVPTASGEVALLQAGERYRRFDGYWGERAALVLDRNRQWKERAFEPVDAVAYERAGDALVGNATNQNLPEGGTLVKGGWDHEHCDICWEKISPHTDPIAVFSEPDHWICRKCYEKFVIPRSLDFIYVEESGRAAGEG
jgi:hypothetical protein